MTYWKPLLKPYSEIIKTASKLFKTSELDAEIELDAKLRELKIPKIAVVVYVNWASHNALSYKEVAKATGLTKIMVQSCLQILRKRFPWLFNFGARPRLSMDRLLGSGINMDWIDAETRRLGVRGMGPMKHLAE